MIRAFKLATPAVAGLLFIFLTAFSNPPFQDAPQSAQKAADSGALADMLKKAKAYCVRLSSASLDFVCLEDISEKAVDRRLYLVPNWGSLSPSTVFGDTPDDHTYLYDYQFVSNNGKKADQRRLLEHDGVKIKDDRDRPTALLTRHFFFQNVLFGAVDLLDESRQSLYRYDLIGREAVDGESAWVVNVVPVPGLSRIVNGGRVWLREKDGGVLKIAWNVKSMESSPEIRETAKNFHRTPEITQVTEYDFEKKGIRFPSRFVITEAYIDKNGNKAVKSITEAVYRNYKFFTVEIDAPVFK